MNWIVLAISAKFEKPFFYAADCNMACTVAMSKNRSPYSILYIVEKPNKERLCINAQMSYLKKSKGEEHESQ